MLWQDNSLLVTYEFLARKNITDSPNLALYVIFFSRSRGSSRGRDLKMRTTSKWFMKTDGAAIHGKPFQEFMKVWQEKAGGGALRHPGDYLQREKK